jgi:hypothetical protein
MWTVCTHTGEKVKCTETVTGPVEQMTEVIKKEWPKHTVLHFCGMASKEKP